jgi:hypothetical protein
MAIFPPRPKQRNSLLTTLTITAILAGTFQVGWYIRLGTTSSQLEATLPPGVHVAIGTNTTTQSARHEDAATNKNDTFVLAPYYANSDSMIEPTADSMSSAPKPLGSCAILFFGLPRSYKSLVLPSIMENVVKPNLRHGCDYFVHFYNVSLETSGRSSLHGGEVYPSDVYLLKTVIRTMVDEFNHNRTGPVLSMPHVGYASDTDEEFLVARGHLVEKYSTEKAAGSDRLVYVPKNEPVSLVANVIKMWHSQTSVWNLMKNYTTNKGPYDRVAVLRSDVVFMTPVDVWSSGKLVNRSEVSRYKGSRDHMEYIPDANNSFVVIPGFSKWPVNDRAIVGPAKAVEIWASDRWRRIEGYVRTKAKKGQGILDEPFLAAAVLPAIKAEVPQVADIVEDESWCFARARVDSYVWILDCDKRFETAEGARKVIQNILHRNCSEILSYNIKTMGREQIQCSE